MADSDISDLLESASKAQKRKRTPKAAPTTKKSTASKGRPSKASRKSNSNRRSSTVSVSARSSPVESRGDEESTSPTGASSDFDEPDFILAEIEHEEPNRPTSISSGENVIPEALMHRLLHHHFQDQTKTVLNPGARGAVSKYMEVFVREALARSAFMRQEADGDGGGDGFLEVEDLEKCAPLLVLDF